MGISQVDIQTCNGALHHLHIQPTPQVLKWEQKSSILLQAGVHPIAVPDSSQLKEMLLQQKSEPTESGSLTEHNNQQMLL